MGNVAFRINIPWKKKKNDKIRIFIYIYIIRYYSSARRNAVVRESFERALLYSENVFKIDILL